MVYYGSVHNVCKYFESQRCRILSGGIEGHTEVDRDPGIHGELLYIQSADRIILVPLMIFLGATLGFSQADKKHESVSKLLAKIIDAIGIVMFVAVIIKTIQKYQDLLTLPTLNSLLHPIVMTILILPYIYSFALYVRYDELFTLAKHFAKDKRKAASIKRQIIWHGNLSLSRLLLIRRSLYRVNFSESNVNGVVRKLIKEQNL